MVKLVRVSYREKNNGFMLPGFDIKRSIEMSLVRPMNQVLMNDLVLLCVRSELGSLLSINVISI